MTGCIVGWAHLPFGKREDDDLESMIVRVAADAVADAGLEPRDIDEIIVGHFGGGFVEQEFPSSLALQASEDFRFKRAMRVENACATGSAAIHQGLRSIAAKESRIVLAIGVEKMTALPGEQIGGVLLKGAYLKEEAELGSFAGVFGRIAQTYFQKYGDKSDALARIAAKNHKNGVANPYAQLRKDLGYEFCREVSDKNPMVAAPLKRTDCSLVSDGAAAVVLTDIETALSLGKAAVFRAAQHVNDFLPMSKRDMSRLEGCEVVWRRALDGARMTLDDLDTVETHDCFTIAELMQYEAMGLTGPGEGERAIEEGWTAKDGKLPVNPSGGLKSKGHPIGATGVSMHVMAAMQATGRAGDMQVEGAKVTGVYNMGGSGVANYCSILEGLR